MELYNEIGYVYEDANEASGGPVMGGNLIVRLMDTQNKILDTHTEMLNKLANKREV